MKTNGFKTCSDCVNKKSSMALKKGTYYCPYVKDILPNGIVYYDTDATECIRIGNFREPKD